MVQNFIYQIFIHDYEHYRELSVETEKLRYRHVSEYISELRNNEIFRIEIPGRSIEERKIHSIVFGSGKIKILAWSQMHGDEPTATAALLDLLNFFSADDEYNDFRKKLFNEITFCFVPMLNPDGAEKNQRENAVGIDINRDAIALQTPEARILMSLRNAFNPDFGFNLHDQNGYYTPGKSRNTSAVSFLAPPFDYDKSISPVRENSMKVIVEIFNVLNQIVPGHLAKYKDDHEPRSFGDNFVKYGTSSILIESGSWNNGGGKDFVRKLNFISLLTAFNSISRGEYKSVDSSEYVSIPQNEENLLDLILRNLTVKNNGSDVMLDIGIKRERFFSESLNDFNSSGFIEELGDLSLLYGITEKDMKGFYAIPGKISDEAFDSQENITREFLIEALKKGITHLRVKNINPETEFTDKPINYVSGVRDKSNEIMPGANADFYITDGSENIKFIVINGFLIDLSEGPGKSINGVIAY